MVDLDTRNVVFSTYLEMAVPLNIMELEARGGVTPEEIVEYTREFGEELVSEIGVECSAIIAAGYGGTPTAERRRQVAGFAGRMAKAIAVMSYCPGGITVFGQHYETKPSA